MIQTLITWLPLTGAALLVLVGLIGIFKPAAMIKPLGLQAQTPLAMSEVRAIFGGINFGGGLVALYLQQPGVYLLLGMAWLMAALVRFYSMKVDSLNLKDSIAALLVDGGMALLFLSSVLA